jgi:hypothetical protein
MYDEQIKPFNFMLTTFVPRGERPADDQRMVLVAPFETDAERWLQIPWVNRYSKRQYQLTQEPRASPALRTNLLDRVGTAPPARRATLGLGEVRISALRLASDALSFRHGIGAVLLHSVARVLGSLQVFLLELVRRTPVELFRRGVESARSAFTTRG